MKIKRALLSVWDKTGIVELATFLSKQNIELLSTGGTSKKLKNAGLEVVDIGDYTGSGSIMDGRVKTLHPKVFGGILADREKKSHCIDLQDIQGLEIDLVIVNFYPFVNEAVQKQLDYKEAIEYIDIGGPSMLRSAAKNFHFIVPLCDPVQYPDFINNYIDNNGEISISLRKKFAAEVFYKTSIYESAIFNYLNKDEDYLPKLISINIKKSTDLRYGENPHQKAAFYQIDQKPLSWHQHQGRILSYNNYADMESAFNITSEFSDVACAIVKHANPCGFGLGENIRQAYKRAVSTDPISYFGGIVGFNCKVNLDIAKDLIQPFLECIIAPSYSDEALDIFKNKKNLRIISANIDNNDNCYSIKSVAGGYLYQEKDSLQGELNNLKIVTKRQPTKLELEAFKLGWKLVRNVKSNAIVYASNKQLIGIGAGQMSRIDSVKNAILKVSEVGLNLKGTIMASDAFFPFSDSIEIAANAGVSALIQPGGSIKDKEVIEKANELGLSMAFTGVRHFLH